MGFFLPWTRVLEPRLAEWYAPVVCMTTSQQPVLLQSPAHDRVAWTGGHRVQRYKRCSTWSDASECVEPDSRAPRRHGDADGPSGTKNSSWVRCRKAEGGIIFQGGKQLALRLPMCDVCDSVVCDGVVCVVGADDCSFDLTSLFVSSEGQLGIVTEATLRLQPRPAFTAVAVCDFDTIEDATSAAADMMRAGIQVRWSVVRRFGSEGSPQANVHSAD